MSFRNKETTSGNEKPKSPQTTTKLYSRFINFIEEMNVINAVWTESKQLLDNYEFEQKAIFKLKKEMVQKDVEFYKICRKLIKDKLKSNEKLNEFLKTKKSAKPEDNQAQKLADTLHCTCDECTIKNLIICGILDTDFIVSASDDKATSQSRQSIKIKLSDKSDKNKKSIENAAAAVAFAAAAALNFDASHGSHHSHYEGDDDNDKDFDGCEDCGLEDDQDDDDDDDDELDSDSDMNDSDFELENDDSDANSDFDHHQLHQHSQLSKAIHADTLNKFKLCKNLYNLHLKFEKEKRSKSMDIITQAAETKANEDPKNNLTIPEGTCTSKSF
jgi:hypothetical protein